MPCPNHAPTMPQRVPAQHRSLPFNLFQETRQSALPLGNQHQIAIDIDTIISDKIQLTDMERLFSGKRVAHEIQDGFFVLRIIVARKMLALHLKHNQFAGILTMAHGKDKVRIDFFAAPALNGIMRAGHISVPPCQGLVAIKIDGNVALILAGKITFVAEVPEKIKPEISITYYWKISYRIIVVLIIVTTLRYL